MPPRLEPVAQAERGVEFEVESQVESDVKPDETLPIEEMSARGCQDFPGPID